MVESDQSWSSYFIILLIIILFGFNYYSYSRFNCPNCPTCPPVKECLSCPVPSSQGLINYMINTLINDIGKSNQINYDELLLKYFILNIPITSDKGKIAFFDKIKKESIEKKYLLEPINIVYLNLSDTDKEKFKKKYNTGIIPNPLFVVNGINLIFGFQNDPSVLKIFVDMTLF
jgi:hypothetical protein